MTYDAYRTLAATCASKCKGLSKAKGFITDGEENLQRVFEDELKNTTGLCSFKHFENNCMEKLREFAIKRNSVPSCIKFLEFKGSSKDAVDQDDLRGRLKS